MLKYGNKEYRNLQEQVLANMRNIEDIIKDKPMMVNNISLNDSTYTPSDGTITLPGLVTTGTEQTVSAKKNFTDTIKVKGAEINAEARVGTYPRSIESTGILNVDLQVEEWDRNNEVDFEKHTISSGAYLYFEYPELLEHYGLHGDDGASSAPYSNYALNKDISIPETITTEEQLKAYVKSSAFASDVDSAGYTIDECIMVNSVAAYSSDIQSIFFNGTNIIVDDILDCQQGEGEQIVGASDPITEPMLKTKNLKVENLEVENSLIGTNGNHVAKAIYVHKISWKYVSNSPNVYLTYLSTKSTPYSSMADIFSHRNETDLTTSEVVEYNNQSAIVKFSSTGAIKSGVGISANNENVSTFAMTAGGFDFVKDEVISSWGI